MRILVCGPRDWADETFIWDVLDCFWHPGAIMISGVADGVDAISCEWARYKGVTVIPFPARWHKNKKAAGPIRNRQMLEEGKPDLVYAFVYRDGPTPGTTDMIKQAERARVRVRKFGD